MATVLVLGAGGVLGEAWMWGYLGGAPGERRRLPHCEAADRHLGRVDRRGSAGGGRGSAPALALRGLATGWRLATSVEAAAARRRGASVEIVAPDAGAAGAMGSDLMNPARRARVLAEGFRQGAAARTPAAG